MADAYLIVLRAINVAAAVFWAGWTFLLAGFHEFAVPPGDDDRTLRRMAGYAGVSQVLGVSGLLAVVAGLLLYWEVSAGVSPGWVRSPYGLTITDGAVAGIVAVIVGAGLVGLTNERMEGMAEDVSPGDDLTDEQSASLEASRNRIRLGERVVAVLLLVAVLTMATAQCV